MISGNGEYLCAQTHYQKHMSVCACLSVRVCLKLLVALHRGRELKQKALRTLLPH